MAYLKIQCRWKGSISGQNVLKRTAAMQAVGDIRSLKIMKRVSLKDNVLFQTLLMGI